MSLDRIEKNVCDVCGRKRSGVLFHHMGVPVMFGCRDCHPKNYRKVQRAGRRSRPGEVKL